MIQYDGEMTENMLEEKYYNENLRQKTVIAQKKLLHATFAAK
jgi:hypothetical protein